jgi:hypothetical protein
MSFALVVEKVPLVGAEAVLHAPEAVLIGTPAFESKGLDVSPEANAVIIPLAAVGVPERVIVVV